MMSVRLLGALALVGLAAAFSPSSCPPLSSQSVRGGFSPQLRATPRSRLAGSNAGRLMMGTATLERPDTTIRSKGGNEVTLDKYTGLSVEVERVEIPEAEIEKRLALRAKDYILEAARFTDGKSNGARMGHTVLIDFEATDVESGAPVQGTKANMYELDLKEGQSEPWKTFVNELSVGMGQDELKSFEFTFPEDYKVPALANKKVRFNATVKRIMNRVPKEPDSRSQSVQRAEVLEELRAEYHKHDLAKLDAKLREAIMETCSADTTKATEAVAWAKFGERSTKDFQWQLIKEEIARVENLDSINDLLLFLREKNEVVWK